MHTRCWTSMYRLWSPTEHSTARTSAVWPSSPSSSNASPGETGTTTFLDKLLVCLKVSTQLLERCRYYTAGIFLLKSLWLIFEIICMRFRKIHYVVVFQLGFQLKIHRYKKFKLLKLCGLHPKYLVDTPLHKPIIIGSPNPWSQWAILVYFPTSHHFTCFPKLNMLVYLKSCRCVLCANELVPRVRAITNTWSRCLHPLLSW
jgi:hypothetical protein